MLNSTFLLDIRTLRVQFDAEQLAWACRGMRINDKSKAIAEGYFCHGKRKVELAQEFDVSAARVSSLIHRIEQNLQERLDRFDRKIVVLFQHK